MLKQQELLPTEPSLQSLHFHFFLNLFCMCVVVEVRAQLWESSPSTMWILETGLSSSGLTARAFSVEPSHQPLDNIFSNCYNSEMRHNFGEDTFSKQIRNYLLLEKSCKGIVH